MACNRRTNHRIVRRRMVITTGVAPRSIASLVSALHGRPPPVLAAAALLVSPRCSPALTMSVPSTGVDMLLLVVLPALVIVIVAAHAMPVVGQHDAFSVGGASTVTTPGVLPWRLPAPSLSSISPSPVLCAPAVPTALIFRAPAPLPLAIVTPPRPLISVPLRTPCVQPVAVTATAALFASIPGRPLFPAWVDRASASALALLSIFTSPGQRRSIHTVATVPPTTFSGGNNRDLDGDWRIAIGRGG